MSDSDITTNKKCQRCDGERMIWVTLRDLGGRQPHSCGVEHIIGCPSCNGKGYITQEDRNQYYRSIGCGSNRV